MREREREREREKREREIFLHDFTVLIWSHSDNVITTKEKDEGKDSLGSNFYGILANIVKSSKIG